MDRQRLTITLRDDTLKKIDQIIDGTKIRNRSHAIEYLVNQTLLPKVSQAIILTGGKGLHMRPFTFEMPKGLLPVGGKPILEHLVSLLRGYDIRDITFSTGHLGEKIKDHFGDGKKFGVNICYLQEENPQGTGGALAIAQKKIKGDTFLVIHGDILIDLNLSDLISFHKEQGTVGTIALTSVPDPSGFGEVLLNGTQIRRFIEKPEKGSQESQLINCGVYIFEKKIFDYIPKDGFSLLEDIFPKLASQRQLSGYIFAGKWVDVGTPQSYEKAIKIWGENHP